MIKNVLKSRYDGTVSSHILGPFINKSDQVGESLNFLIDQYNFDK